jgi:hypothetical protein
MGYVEGRWVEVGTGSVAAVHEEWTRVNSCSSAGQTEYTGFVAGRTFEAQMGVHQTALAAASVVWVRMEGHIDLIAEAGASIVFVAAAVVVAAAGTDPVVDQMVGGIDCCRN